MDSRKGKQKQEKSFLKSPVVLALLIFAAVGIILVATLTGAFPLSTSNFQIDIFQSSGASRQTLPTSGNILEVYAGEPAAGKVTTSNYIVTFGQAVALPSCGDGIAESPEQCDGTDFAGDTCDSIGFASGALKCDTASCAFDTSSCKPYGARSSYARFFGPTEPIILSGGESAIIDAVFNNVIEIKIDSLTHDLRVSGIFDNAIEVALRSETIKGIIQLGETKEFDVNGDNKNDLAITYLSKSSLGVKLKVTALAAAPQPEAAQPVPTTPAAPTAPEAKAPIISSFLLSLIILAILLVTIGGVIALRMAHHPAVTLEEKERMALIPYVEKAKALGVGANKLYSDLVKFGWREGIAREIIIEIYRR